jgi:coenzyme F420-0:L-glutamate ligase/coenzyme F420-1:gamma-L-glutamate ligase
VTTDRLQVWAPDGIGEIHPGDDLAALLGDALEGDLHDGDVVVVTSKVVSKAEGRVVQAEDREQAITDETVRQVARREHPGGVLRIVENRLGLVMAAAGVDASNTPDGTVLLLPVDPDASARALRAAWQERFGVRVGVVVSDTAGRAWREGLTDIAIGAAGLTVLDDLRGGTDAHGRPLSVTVTAIADEVAAASELVRGKAEGRPVAVVRGLARFVTDDDGPGARALVRPPEADLFRLGAAEAWQEGYEAGRAESHGTGRAVSPDAGGARTSEVGRAHTARHDGSNA